MDYKEFDQIISDLTDFEKKIVSLNPSASALIQLKQKRDLLLEMKDDISDEIRSIEFEFLLQKREILSKLEDKKNVPRTKRLFKISDSIPQQRARAMRNLQSEQRMKIHAYDEIKFIIDENLKKIEEMMIDIYIHIKKTAE